MLDWCVDWLGAPLHITVKQGSLLTPARVGCICPQHRNIVGIARESPVASRFWIRNIRNRFVMSVALVADSIRGDALTFRWYNASVAVLRLLRFLETVGG